MNMNLLKKSLGKLALFSYMFLMPVISFAADNNTPSNPNKPGTIVNPLGSGTDTIMAFIEKILKGAIQIGMPLIALAIIYCGFLFVSARGNSEKLTKAKEALLYTLIGAAILLGSWAIAQIISNTVLAL